MKRIISLMLTLAVALSLLVLAGRVPPPEEAWVNQHLQRLLMNYLAVSGRVQTQSYTLLPLRKRRWGGTGNPSLLCNARPVRRTWTVPEGGIRWRKKRQT